jgi:hypothetical protein
MNATKTFFLFHFIFVLSECSTAKQKENKIIEIIINILGGKLSPSKFSVHHHATKLFILLCFLRKYSRHPQNRITMPKNNHYVQAKAPNFPQIGETFLFV